MCLVVIAWQQHAEFPLILAGNRDEFHSRPTQSARWWPDRPDILGGRDLRAGGTWLAVHRDGRFATVTNFRDAQHEPARFRSRGGLVSGFLDGELAPGDYLASIDGEKYAGFNLLLGDRESLWYLTNRDGGPRELPPGIYGQSNALLDGDWHKVRHAKRRIAELLRDDRINETELLRFLADRSRAPAASIDNDRLPFETAHAISAPFIVLPEYGTRSSTVLLYGRNGDVRFHERRFDADGMITGNSDWTC